MNLRSIILLLLLSISIFSCAKPNPPPRSVSEAEKKFEQICAEEYHYTCITQMTDNAFWVYIPTENPLLIIKASGTPPGGKSTNEQLVPRYVDTLFEKRDANFLVEYDIGKVKSYNKDMGYTSTYTEEFQTMQSNMLYAFQRTFFDIEHPRNLPEKMPEFYVMVISDIKNGVEFECIFNVIDLKRGLSNPPDLPSDEFALRYVAELRGSPAITGDKAGKHVEFTNISWTDFLARQNTNRINAKFGQSSIPPSDKIDEEILKLTAQTLQSYNFKSYREVELRDLTTNLTKSYVEADVSKIRIPDLEPGKYHIIEFFNDDKFTNLHIKPESPDLLDEEETELKKNTQSTTNNFQTNSNNQ